MNLDFIKLARKKTEDVFEWAIPPIVDTVLYPYLSDCNETPEYHNLNQNMMFGVLLNIRIYSADFWRAIKISTFYSNFYDHKIKHKSFQSDIKKTLTPSII